VTIGNGRSKGSFTCFGESSFAADIP